MSRSCSQPWGRSGRGSLSWGRSGRGSPPREDEGGWESRPRARGGRGVGRGSVSWGRSGRGFPSWGRGERASLPREDGRGLQGRSGWDSPPREDGGGLQGRSGWDSPAQDDGGGLQGRSGWCSPAREDEGGWQGRSGWGSPARLDGGGWQGRSGWGSPVQLDEGSGWGSSVQLDGGGWQGWGFLPPEDEGGEESKSPSRGANGWVLPREEDVSNSLDHDVAMSLPSWRNLVGRNPIEGIQSLQSSLKSTFDEYCKQFQDMEAELIRIKGDNVELGEIKRKTEAELIRAKRENKELVERNKKLEEELKRAKEGEEYSKEQLKRAKEGEESSKQNLEQTRNKLQELCQTFDAVKEECDKVRNQQGAAPQLKKRKYVLKVFEVNDLLNCPICWEPWTQSGEHNVCSLSCGHFFGRSCITRWILSDGSRGSSSCPVCSSRVTLSDIRHHYVSQIYDEEGET